ncbi:MAG: hypothetical protein JXR83_02630 [Deltaproteobacteria bacterium]|nr:hypothetical protein [Deltaproteobacteria bacterium]
MRIAVLVASLLVGANAAAYIPAAVYLLDRLVETRHEQGLRSIKVTQRTTLHGSGEPAVCPETVYYATPWKMRSELRLESGTLVTLRDGALLRVEEPGKTAKTVRTPLPDLMAEFFACADESEDSGRERLLADLTAYGIDVKKRTLTRWDGRIAVLIGADPWDPKSPQVYLDKDGYFPLRFVFRERAGNADRLVDVRLLGYGGAKTGGWYPEVIEIYVDGVLTRRSVVDGIELSPKLAPALFKVK